jgi:hypothetical protein
MSWRERFVWLAIAGYLFCLLCGLSFTLFRWSPLPKHVTRFFYGLMAPYQGYNTRNLELVADGKKPDGSWERIDRAPYLPGSHGERYFRGAMLSSRVRGPERTRRDYETFARRLTELEAERGKAYAEIRLQIETWPTSPDGYEALRDAEHIEYIDPLEINS